MSEVEGGGPCALCVITTITSGHCTECRNHDNCEFGHKNLFAASS